MLLFCNSHFVMSNACETSQYFLRVLVDRFGTSARLLSLSNAREISLFFTIFEIPHTWFGMTQHYVSTAVYSPFRFNPTAWV